MSPSGSTDDVHAGGAIVQIALSLLLAALSWTCIEEPIRRGSRIPFRGKIQGWSPFNYRNIRAVSTFALMLFLISGYSSLNADKPADPSTAIIDTSSNGQGTTAPVTDPGIPAVVIPEAPIPLEPQPQSEDSSKPAANAGITAIGDSVLLDAAPHLEKLLPGIVIDGKVGRQMYQAQVIVDRLKAEGKLGDRVVIELGTNGAFSSKQLRELLSSLQDARKIVLINTRVPRKWQDTVNSTLEEVANEYANTEIMDWYSASKDKQTYFADDGVHLKREGAESYAFLLSKTLQGG
jgi:lysophospholipase L1-like esterase